MPSWGKTVRGAAAAHGLAVFLRRRLFGAGGEARADTEASAARTGRGVALRHLGQETAP
ncbi:hypothetical protein AB0D59_20785 [Streptomyces sp. NPDC048417]|uniref:hypothetical protein n=1 Tax=Streptomyces sp. NPDC048417 TaxID=3155387 RepID=UPI003422FFF4